MYGGVLRTPYPVCGMVRPVLMGRAILAVAAPLSMDGRCRRVFHRGAKRRRQAPLVEAGLSAEYPVLT